MSYSVIIDGKDISSEVKGIQVSDRQGAQADDIRVWINNSDNINLKRGGVLEVFFGGFSSGKMNVDGIYSDAINTQIGAISAPLSAKEKHTRHWRSVRLFDIVNDMAVGLGLSVYYQGVENFYYENVTQFNETDLAFLNRLCSREGYSLKVDDNRLVIYDGDIVELLIPVRELKQKDITEKRISFSDNPNKVKSVTVKYYNGERLISHTASRDVEGESVTVREYVASDGEAERFSRGYLKTYAQCDVTVDCFIPLTDEIAAGNCVEFTEWTMFNGGYVIFECCHDPENNKTRLRGRRVWH